MKVGCGVSRAENKEKAGAGRIRKETTAAGVDEARCLELLGG